MAQYENRGKNKLWSVRFRIENNGELKYKRLSGFERKKDAENAYREYMENLKKSESQKTIPIFEKLFDEVFQEYLVYKKSKIKESTYYDLVNGYNVHIYPYFSKYKISEIGKQTILQWQQTLNCYSYAYKSKMRNYLYSFYKYLYFYYDIDNVVARVEPFIKPKIKKEMNIWTLEEFNHFIDTFDNDLLYKTFFTLLYYSGCRLGEILALNYNDINFKDKTLKITKSLTAKVEGKPYLITSPKNISSYRTIILPDITINILKQYLIQFPEVQNNEFLFGSTKPLDDHTIHRRLDAHVLLADVKKIRIHDFRHSHASFLINLGANIVLVAKRLGHANTQQTLNTYVHLYPNSDFEIVNKINNIA